MQKVVDAWLKVRIMRTPDVEEVWGCSARWCCDRDLKEKKEQLCVGTRKRE